MGKLTDTARTLPSQALLARCWDLQVWKSRLSSIPLLPNFHRMSHRTPTLVPADQLMLGIWLSLRTRSMMDQRPQAGLMSKLHLQECTQVCVCQVLVISRSQRLTGWGNQRKLALQPFGGKELYNGPFLVGLFDREMSLRSTLASPSVPMVLLA